jgi:hypothetical protein
LSDHNNISISKERKGLRVRVVFSALLRDLASEEKSNSLWYISKEKNKHFSMTMFFSGPLDGMV